MLSANVSGHRQTGEDVARMRAMTDQSIPGLGPDGYETLHLTSFVGVPDPERPGSSSGQSYENHNLTLGDEVTIRVIETDKLDEPLPLHPDATGPIAMRSSNDPEGEL